MSRGRDDGVRDSRPMMPWWPDLREGDTTMLIVRPSKCHSDRWPSNIRSANRCRSRCPISAAAGCARSVSEVRHAHVVTPTTASRPAAACSDRSGPNCRRRWMGSCIGSNPCCARSIVPEPGFAREVSRFSGTMGCFFTVASIWMLWSPGHTVKCSDRRGHARLQSRARPHLAASD